MHVRTIPSKTLAGSQELQSRNLKLSPHSRTVLIAVDGQRSVEELERTFASFGQVRLILEDLLQLGLIAVPMSAAHAPSAPDKGAEQLDLMGVRKRINELAVEAGGLRAFLFTLKLEHCYSPASLRGLMSDFHKLLTKGKGQAHADRETETIERVLDRLEKTEAQNPVRS